MSNMIFIVTLTVFSINNNFNLQQEQRLLSDELTFKKILKSDKFYEDFVKDFNRIAADDCIEQTPVIYNKYDFFSLLHLYINYLF